MYAVIKTGGKQYKVASGDLLKIEQLPEDAGKSVEFTEVLMVVDGEKVDVGTPFLKNTKVVGEVVQHGRGEKVYITKFRRRKHYLNRTGHRQNFTEVKITAINQ